MIYCILTEARNIAEMDSNFTAATRPLPDSIWSELEALDLDGIWRAGEKQEG